MLPGPAKAMKVKTFITCMLLILSVWTLNLHAEAKPTVCGTKEYTHGSDFQSNLNHVLESLVENASTSGFNTSVEGQNINSDVYGFVQCRGDLNSSDCKVSASTAKRELLDRCSNTSGFIYSSECFLRYDNQNFYNDPNESSEFQNLCNQYTASSEQFENTTGEMLSKLINKTVRSLEHFATEKIASTDVNVREIYGLAQCWRGLSDTNCRSCLAAGRSIISGPNAVCQTGVVGAQCISTNCALRYEIYPFFNTSTFPPPPAPPLPPPPAPPPPGESLPVSGGKRSKVLWITLGVLAATIGLIAAIWHWKPNFFYRRKHWERFSQPRGGGGINLSPIIANQELIFKYDILREAASNFKEENKLGEGGFGSVFKGVLPDAREVAIKRLTIGSRQGDTEFLNEANLISRVQHRNLVKLLGCCVESSERLLVYEYLQNSSLDKILFDTTKRHLLHWRDRYEIIVGTARGLAYLHEESEIRIIHRDIKPSNILLDDQRRPKIADFGLAKLFADDQSHVSTRVAGTLGYMAPEYALRGQLTEKADVFSFGVLLLEIISGRKNQSLPQHTQFLIEATWRLYKEERALEVMDPSLEGSYSLEEALRVIKIGLLCIQAAAPLRPSMSHVVSMMTSEREHLASPTKPVAIDLESVATPHQLQRQRLRVIDPDKTSSSTVTPTTPSDHIHSLVVDSSGTLEPR